MKKELLFKYLNNNCTETELREVVAWINSDELDNEDEKLVLGDWNSYKENHSIVDEEQFSIIFDKIQEKISNKNEGNGFQAKERSLILNVSNWLTKAAAVLLIPVLTFLFYTISENKREAKLYANLATDSLEVIAPIGSRTVVHLSDGSEVYLNYGSKIKYPQFFTGNTRDVILSGEGFFKVSHNPEKPFIVKTGNLKIKAVGTTFNVLAYPDNNFIETTLLNGKVIVDKVMSNGKSQTLETMTPGQHINYSIQTEAISLSEGNTEKYVSWMDGKLIFDDASIVEVTNRLSRIFNVDFQLKDEIKDYIYTVTFTDEHLFQILDLMTIATPVTYKTLPRKKLPDGTFSKQQILIEKKK